MKSNLKKNIFTHQNDLKNEKELKTIIAQNINYVPPSKLMRFVWSNWFFYVSLVLLLPGILMWFARKRKVARICQDLPNARFIFFQKWFNQNYDDFKIETRPPKSQFQNLIKESRGIGIPSDAWIQDFTNGWSLNNQQTVINLASVLWHWKRSNGKGTSHYLRRKIYGWIINPNPKWRDFNFKIQPDSIFSKKTNTLENDYFNKKWIYQNDNPTKIRMLLTPAIQEDILQVIGKQNSWKTFSFIKKGDIMLMSMTTEAQRDPFAVNLSIFSNLLKPKKMMDKIWIDAQNDIEDAQIWLKTIAVFRQVL